MFCCPNDSPSTHPLHTYTTPPFHSRTFKHNSVVQINKKDSLARIQPITILYYLFSLKGQSLAYSQRHRSNKWVKDT